MKLCLFYEKLCTLLWKKKDYPFKINEKFINLLLYYPYLISTHGSDFIVILIPTLP